ncbi:hypothetical protein AVEN_231041-1 [Araneus ventricosus]|uniref:MATH domain-containing protein n=1 Tax=Araneus ventricosus TaxID=182803 RepID=A0A4Y2A2Z0_ARAVE|nr:hypothetical protein AVEN_231041-1 [Araneus ventricosus]
MFIADSFESTSWMLHLYPRGNRAVDEDYISFYLHRRQHCNGLERFFLNCELSFFASDGSTLCSYEFKETDSSFLRCSTLGRRKRKDILMKEKAAYLPQGTLTARCRMWKSQDGKHNWARTGIGIETISSLEMVENFSGLEMNQNVKFLIRSSSGERFFFITVNIYLNNSSCCEGKM